MKKNLLPLKEDTLPRKNKFKWIHYSIENKEKTMNNKFENILRKITLKNIKYVTKPDAIRSRKYK